MTEEEVLADEDLWNVTDSDNDSLVASDEVPDVASSEGEDQKAYDPKDRNKDYYNDPTALEDEQ